MPIANLANTFTLYAERVPLDFPDVIYPSVSVPMNVGSGPLPPYTQAAATVPGGPLIAAASNRGFPSTGYGSFSAAGQGNIIGGIGSYGSAFASFSGAGGMTQTVSVAGATTYQIGGGYKAYSVTILASGLLVANSLYPYPQQQVINSQLVDTWTGPFTVSQVAYNGGGGSIYAPDTAGAAGSENNRIGLHPSGLAIPAQIVAFDLSDAGDDFDLQNFPQGINKSPFYMTASWIVANVNQLPAFTLQVLMILPDWSQYVRLNILPSGPIETAILANMVQPPDANPCVQYDPSNGYFLSTQDATTGKINLFILSPYNPQNSGALLPQQGSSYNPATDGAFPGFRFNPSILYGNRPFATPGIFALGDNSLRKCCTLTAEGQTVQSLYPTASGTR